MTPQDPIYSLPTNVGAAKLAYAMANQLTVDISHMAIGDGNGVAVNPTADWPALAREVHRAQLNQLYQHPDNPNWLVAELVLPAEVGGWTIREIALYDVDGDLIFIGNHAEQYKPVQSQGSDETKTIRMVILVSSVATVTLKTDPTTVMATIDYVQRELAKLDHKQSVRYTTTAAVVLSGLGVQAGGDWAAALTAGDRVLVKNQAAAKDNGIYVVAGGMWVRSADADASIEVTPGLVVAVEQGTTLADTRWQLVTDGAIVLDTTALTFQNITKGFLSLSGGQMTGALRAKVGGAAAENPNDAGFVFDNDTGMFSPADGQLQLAANGEVLLEKHASGAVSIRKGVRVPKGAPPAADLSSASGYTFGDDGDTGLFAEGGTANADSDLVFRVDGLVAGRIKKVMKSSAGSGWGRLTNGQILQWASFLVTPVANGVTGWTATLPTTFLTQNMQSFAVQGSGCGFNKFQISVEGLNLGSVVGFVYAEDTTPRVLRIWAIGE